MTPTLSSPPLVWRDMDQKALDDAYDQDVYAPNRPLIVTRRIAASERARAILGEPQRVAYGPSEYERLDIFRALRRRTRAGQCLHSRRRLAAQQGARLSLSGRAAGARRRALLHPRFHQCRAGGRRSVPDVRAGAPRHRLDLAQRRKFGGDRERFYISAHSSGSHLDRLRAHPRLARGRPAGKFLQGRAAAQRHVRPRSGAAVEALILRQVHRRDGGGA